MAKAIKPTVKIESIFIAAIFAPRGSFDLGISVNRNIKANMMNWEVNNPTITQAQYNRLSSTKLVCKEE